MFYEPRKRNHGLAHDPFNAIVAPRPIGWITSMSAKGEINLAPYSFFNGLSAEPPIVMFCSEGRKDSVVFVEETKEFVCNLATWDLRNQMNTTSGPYPRGVDEMKEAGLDPAPSILVKPPRVKASPRAMECRRMRTARLHALDGQSPLHLQHYVADTPPPRCAAPFRRQVMVADQVIVKTPSSSTVNWSCRCLPL